jgi:hypothetical protein
MYWICTFARSGVIMRVAVFISLRIILDKVSILVCYTPGLCLISATGVYFERNRRQFASRGDCLPLTGPRSWRVRLMES